MGAIFMKLGLAPATSIIFKKESLWIGSELRWNLMLRIGIESITTTGNYFRCAGVEVSLWLLVSLGTLFNLFTFR
jgi:hypothetical protein